MLPDDIQAEFDITKTMEFIHSTSWKGSRLGLSRTIELLRLLDNPQKKLKFIHIAGTNGKGSTAAMLASVLKEAGYKTGLYTSPYIHKFNERIQVNAIPISDEELTALANHLCLYTSRMEDTPTEFEIVTAMALLYFYHEQCDIVVLEVGLGGRLDATNVIDTPEVAVITSIALDHTAELGNTIEEIAVEKAGIIKSGGVAVSYLQNASVEQIIRERCLQQNTEVSFIDRSSIKFLHQNLNGQQFNYDDISDLEIPLLGKYQLLNAAVAITTIQALQSRGWSITENALRSGLRKTVWPARFEVMRTNPIFIVDGAHNPHGVRAAANNLSLLFPDKKITFIIGVLSDKNYGEMLEILAQYAGLFIAVTPGSSRALPAAELAVHIKKYSVDTIICDSISQGVETALGEVNKIDIICAIGSLYMIGEVREYLKVLQ